MKTKFLLAAFCFFACALSLKAATVSEQQAQTVAIHYFMSQTQAKVVNASLVYTKTENSGAADFYVFNITTQTGFVIVAADDNIQPILAFSDESYFKEDVNNRTGLSDWVTNWSTNIAKAVSTGVQASDYTNALWASYRNGTVAIDLKSKSVAPMVKTTWDQENDVTGTRPPYLYNALCPYNSTDGQQCLTGCVATAMAQLMSYWKFPTRGAGSNSYDAVASYACGTNTCTHDYGTLSENFANTTFQWSDMPTVLNGSTTTTQNNAVDVLMYACGIAVNMAYGDDAEDGSGAYMAGSAPSAQYAWGNYFGYNSSVMQSISQPSDSNTWITDLKNELNAGRPFLFSGFAKQGGHCWVCDGYNTTNMFHMNWGWGGAGNGYYSVGSNINVPDEYNFTSSFSVLIGIEPNVTSSCGEPSALKASFIGTTSAILSWTPASGTETVNLRWRVSGSSTWKTASTSAADYTISNLTAGTEYEWQIQTACATGYSSFSASSYFTTYCTAAGNNNTFDFIAKVQLGSIQNSSTGDNGVGYENFTDISTNLTAGSSHFITVTSGADYSGDVTTCYYTVYIDYNHDGIFESNELVAEVSTPGTAAVESKSFTIPSTAYIGSTRARILMQYAGGTYQTNPCASYSNGDVQDYTINITSANEASYCASTGNNNVFGFIEEVQFGSITNTAGGNDNGYTNFTNLSTNLVTGSTHYITLTSGFDSPDDVTNCYYTVYIDYNHNGVFDADELVVEAETKDNNDVKSKNFTVPVNAYLGTTRMRIQMQYAGGTYETNPCASFNNGDVQDYDVNIVPPAGSLSGNSDAFENLSNLSALQLFPNPAQDNLNIAFNTDNDASSQISVYNVSGQRILSSQVATITGSNTYNLNTSVLSNGIYIFEIANNGDVQRMKFTIGR
jgi:hypothetical protein